jgi:NlpC/P60 family
MLGKTHSPALLLLCVLVSLAFAGPEDHASPPIPPRTRRALHRPSLLLNSSEGLSVISAALESRRPAHSKPDCSHLVHTIYERAGFPYSYVSSSDLYRGVPEFRLVVHAQPGDLVAWPGHVGIVVNPSQDTFFSSLRSGLGVDSYSASYWKERGQHRFFRYAKAPSIARSEKPGNPAPHHSHPITIPAASHSQSAAPL